MRPVILPHHRTCGFPHPAVEPATLLACKIRWNQKRYRRRTQLLRARCSSGWAATLHDPRVFVATPRAGPFNPSCRSLRSRSFRSCHLNQKHFRICLRTHPSMSRRGCRLSASPKDPHQPRTSRTHSSAANTRWPTNPGTKVQAIDAQKLASQMLVRRRKPASRLHEHRSAP